MLLSLRIQNFTLIDELELEFGAGLNVLTGETGSGKSIILDAIDLVLGGKANARNIRAGMEKATIEGTFAINDRVRQWLIDREFDLPDDTVVCSRELSLNGANLRSRLRVNGAICNRQLTQELREFLIEITAQGQTVRLTNHTHQRELLDLYGGNALIQQRENIATAHIAYQQVYQTWLDRQQNEQQRLQRLDLLQYQATELEQVNLTTPDELIDLEIERQRLSHVVDLQQQSYAVYQLLYQNDTGGSSIAVADLLGKAESTLINMVNIDSSLQSSLDLVSLALAQITEAGREINYYGDALEADPDRLLEIEDRIRTLKLICRKYGPSLTEAIEHQLAIQTELNQLTGAGISLEELEQQAADLQAQLTQACQQLTTLRQQAAIDLEQQLILELKPLAMDKVQFQVEITPQPPTSIGADAISFHFSPNPGEPLQPLAATASGGEMSRFLLALKACFVNNGGAGTLIFDEIDAGVSGKVAQSIAGKLHHLSQSQQVLCVTHQPLIAAMADRHFRVIKATIDSNGTSAQTLERTVVRIEELHTQQQRRDEIAQIAGGQSAQEAISFATSLLSQAKTTKKTSQKIRTKRIDRIVL